MAMLKQDMKDFDIEQGPVFLRMIAFLSGAGSLGCAVYKMVHLNKAMSHPVMYILWGYIGVFALTTMLFEAKTTWIEKIPGLNKYQDMLIKHANFMTLMGGRGVFYLFQATLWMAHADSLSEIIYMVCAGALAFVGALHLAAHWGIMPNTIAQKAIATAEKVTGKDLNGDGTVGSKA
eukprot:CAMPEP_0206469694 /NCGR_PEP_ID=MMETSP0324_2-20121206/30446_1 /ASSEMBLY_ACC=CAM_ASM_000836 /TAXON_ID=2866 /ORGANISM="Crypthecodinium cohnii, Strain Seligo" /LENGTH=176 /DNA_ID=CAMNT_0053943529 /DNA_START=108 /DNA_END=638 /DNA_ORIENTATION=-